VADTRETGGVVPWRSKQSLISGVKPVTTPWGQSFFLAWLWIAIRLTFWRAFSESSSPVSNHSIPTDLQDQAGPLLEKEKKLAERDRPNPLWGPPCDSKRPC
jgi:hypothetical protein